jgi:hypothetical protein
MNENLAYETWRANKAVCRCLHYLSEELPTNRRASYLNLLEEVTSTQKAIVISLSKT